MTFEICNYILYITLVLHVQILQVNSQTRATNDGGREEVAARQPLFDPRLGINPLGSINENILGDGSSNPLLNQLARVAGVPGGRLDFTGYRQQQAQQNSLAQLLRLGQNFAMLGRGGGLFGRGQLGLPQQFGQGAFPGARTLGRPGLFQGTFGSQFNPYNRFSGTLLGGQQPQQNRPAGPMPLHISLDGSSTPQTQTGQGQPGQGQPGQAGGQTQQTAQPGFQTPAIRVVPCPPQGGCLTGYVCQHPQCAINNPVCFPKCIPADTKTICANVRCPAGFDRCTPKVCEINQGTACVPDCQRSLNYCNDGSQRACPLGTVCVLGRCSQAQQPPRNGQLGFPGVPNQPYQQRTSCQNSRCNFYTERCDNGVCSPSTAVISPNPCARHNCVDGIQRCQEINQREHRCIPISPNQPTSPYRGQQQNYLYQPGQQAQYPPQNGQFLPTQQVPRLPNGQVGQYPPQQGQFPPQNVRQGQFTPQNVQQGQFPPQNTQQGQFPPPNVQQGQFPSHNVQQGQYPPQINGGQLQLPNSQNQFPQGLPQSPPRRQTPSTQYPPQGTYPGQQPVARHGFGDNQQQQQNPQQQGQFIQQPYSQQNGNVAPLQPNQPQQTNGFNQQQQPQQFGQPPYSQGQGTLTHQQSQPAGFNQQPPAQQQNPKQQFGQQGQNNPAVPQVVPKELNRAE